MSHHYEPSQGLLGFLISFTLMLLSQLAPELANTNQWHVPAWIMEVSQVIAWWCVGGTFLLTMLNYLGRNPFKKKKKG